MSGAAQIATDVVEKANKAYGKKFTWLTMPAGQVGGRIEDYICCWNFNRWARGDFGTYDWKNTYDQTVIEKSFVAGSSPGWDKWYKAGRHPGYVQFAGVKDTATAGRALKVAVWHAPKPADAPYEDYAAYRPVMLKSGTDVVVGDFNYESAASTVGATAATSAGGYKYDRMDNLSGLAAAAAQVGSTHVASDHKSIRFTVTPNKQ